MSEITLAEAEAEYASIMAFIRSQNKPNILWSLAPQTKGGRKCVGHSWREVMMTGAQFIVCSKCNMIITPREELEARAKI